MHHTDFRFPTSAFRRRILMVLAVLAVSACERDQVFTDMSDSTFVKMMVDLRKLPVGEVMDVDARNLRRDAILRKYGVTAAQVESTAVRLANDPALASDIWRAIENPNQAPPAQQKKNGA